MKKYPVFLALIFIILFAIDLSARTLSNEEKQYTINVISAIKGLPVDQVFLQQQTPDHSLKSATRIARNLPYLKGEIEPDLYAKLTSRVEMQAYINTDHFRIHYDTTGYDAVPTDDYILLPGVPDFVDSAALIFERVWAYELDTLGYADILDYGQPVPDGGAGGDNRYDIYIINIGPMLYYGATFPENQDIVQKKSSYIYIDNDYTDPVFQALGYGSHPLDALKVTAAHEFFHALHYSLDYLEDSVGRAWWQEVTSTWIEDKVFDEVNDYLFLIKYFYRFPYLSLETFGGTGDPDQEKMHPYAACVWAKFLDEKYGEEVIKEIWQICSQVSGYNVIPATEQVLANHGTTFDQAWQEFTIWNWFTGEDRADTLNRYSEAHLWADTMYLAAIFDEDWDEGVPVVETIANACQQLSASYYVIDKSMEFQRGGMQAIFQGDQIADQGNEWRMNILGWNSATNRTVKVPVDSVTNYGTGIFRGWDSYSHLVLIPTIFGYTYNKDREGYSLNLTYNSAFNDSSPVVVDSLLPDGQVMAGDCLEFYINTYDPNMDALSFYTVPPVDSVEGLTLTQVDDSTAAVSYCPEYDLIDSVVAVDFYVVDPDSNYAVVRINFKITYFPGLAESRKMEIFGYPNPFHYSTDDHINLRFFLPDSALSGDIDIYVFTVAGDLVYERKDFIDTPIGRGEDVLVWDGKNTNGKELAGGIYILKIRAGNKSADGKIAILK